MDEMLDKLINAAPTLVVLALIVYLFIQYIKTRDIAAKEGTKAFLTHIERRDNVLAEMGKDVAVSQKESTRMVTEAVSKCENRMADLSKESTEVINKNTAVIGEVKGFLSSINFKINGGKTERRTGLGHVTEPKAEGERRQA